MLLRLNYLTRIVWDGGGSGRQQDARRYFFRTHSYDLVLECLCYTKMFKDLSEGIAGCHVLKTSVSTFSDACFMASGGIVSQ
jgi:hypothetical protein